VFYFYAQFILGNVFASINFSREIGTESHVGRHVIRCPVLMSIFNHNLNLSTDFNRVHRLEMIACVVSADSCIVTCSLGLFDPEDGGDMFLRNVS
jgi:hypothetical protein